MMTDVLKQSNYFKGGILVLAYLVIMVGYYLGDLDFEAYGVDRFELMDGVSLPISRSFKTIGRGAAGMAY